MMRILLCFTVVLALGSSGCTVVGGVLGGGRAISHNTELQRRGDWQTPTRSVAANVLVGAAIGFALDMFLLSRAFDSSDCITYGYAECR